MTQKITILIADDHELVREGMRMLFGREPDFDLVGVVADGDAALRQTLQKQPQVLILDLGLPLLDGLEVARRLRQSGCTTRVLALTARTDAASVRSAQACGIGGYVPKSEGSIELIAAIRALAQGQRHFSPQIAELADSGSATLSLTAREREILGCVADGLSSREIATRLAITLATVLKHRENLSRKLGTRNAAEMTAYAMRNGIEP
jgi:Response regulator containing a CheY-like receiver domain and an HTH DNA-binding domain